MIDWPSVRAVHLAAFGDYGQVVANLVDDLRDAVARGEGLSLVAVERDQVNHAGYYAAFVIDPDGNNVEAVFHGDRQLLAA